MPVLRDVDIRRALHGRLRAEHASEPDTLVLDELGLCQGAARVDLVVVNGTLNGFEIKSEADRLHRLAGQRRVYGAVLDTVTLVTCAKHLPSARRAVPRWWGLEHARVGDRGVELVQVRVAQPNPRVDLHALARLLWRDEALVLLTDHGLEGGLRSKPRSVLWRALADGLDRDALSDGVRAALKDRPGWRSGK